MALHYLVQLTRPRMGHGGDQGGRRTPWIVGGMGVLSLGGALAAAATVWMGHDRASGLALAVARGQAAMPVLLCLHLGAVLALFVTLPYGKFAHAVYRLAALLKYAVERRLPSTLRLGGD